MGHLACKDLVLATLCHAWFIHPQALENPEHLNPPYLLLLQILPRHTSFNGTSLANYPTKNRLQATPYHVQVPEWLQHTYLISSSSHKLAATTFHSSNHGLLLAHPHIRSKKTLTDCSFMLAVPNLWNKLPAEICSSPTLNIFKSRLKT